MAAQLGNDKKWFVQSATPGTFNEVAGQGSLKRTQKAEAIDIGDKNTAPYGKTATGNFNIGVQLSGVVNLPDTNGVERIYTKWKARQTEVFQERKAPFTDTDVVFECVMSTLSCDIDEPKDGASAYDMTFAIAAAPTVDLIG